MKLWLGLALVAGLGAQEVSQSGRTLAAERPLVAQAERARHGMVASVRRCGGE